MDLYCFLKPIPSRFENCRPGRGIRGETRRPVPDEYACPHIGTPLEIQPDRFLDQSGQHILCSTHGALFQVEDGLCVAGPCVDEKLTPVAIDIRDNGVYVNEQELPTLWPPRAAPPKLDD